MYSYLCEWVLFFSNMFVSEIFVNTFFWVQIWEFKMTVTLDNIASLSDLKIAFSCVDVYFYILFHVHIISFNLTCPVLLLQWNPISNWRFLSVVIIFYQIFLSFPQVSRFGILYLKLHAVWPHFYFIFIFWFLLFCFSSFYFSFLPFLYIVMFSFPCPCH